MARISLYVPDDLSKRMEAARDEVNWSEVARPALTAAVAAYEHRKGRNMTTAIERLRTSKERADQQDKLEGNAHGRAWAEHSAEYRMLRDLSLRRSNRLAGDPFEILHAALDPADERPSPEEFDELIRFPTGKDKPDDEYVVRPSLRSDEYLFAFIEGAVEFFKEVRADVESMKHPFKEKLKKR